MSIISDAAWPPQRTARMGPFEAPGGQAVVFAGLGSGVAPWISTDGGSSWSQSTAWGLANSPSTIDVIRDGNIAYVMVVTGTAVLVRPFNLNTLSWGTSTGVLTIPADSSAFLAVRSTGLVVYHQGAVERIMGTDYMRVVVTTRVGTAWQSPILAPPGQTGTAASYHVKGAVGAGDRVQLQYSVPGSSTQTVTFRADNTLSNATALGANPSNYEVGISAFSGGQWAVPHVFWQNTSTRPLRVARAAPSDSPTWSFQAAVGGEQPELYSEVVNSPPGAVVYDSTNKLHLFRVRDDNQNITYNNDQGTGTWTTPELFATADTQGISAGLIDGGNSIGVLYNDAGTVRFNKLVLQQDPPPTAAPALSSTSKTTTSIALSWTAVGDASTYELQRKLSSQGDASYVTVQNTSALTRNDTGRLNDTSYSYRVRGVNSGGAGPWSNVLVESTNAIQAPVISESGKTETSVSVLWNAVPEASSIYQGQMSTDGGSNWSSILSVTSPWNELGLSPGTTYTFRVRGTNSGGQGPWSNVLSITTLGGSEPNNDFEGTGSISGGGSLAASGVKWEPAPEFEGTGFISGGGNLQATSAVALYSPWSEWVSTISSDLEGTGHVSGGGSLVPSGRKNSSGTVQVSADGSVSAAYSSSRRGSSAVSAGGSLGSLGTVQHKGSAVLSVGGELFAQGSTHRGGQIVVSAGGSLSPDGVSGRLGSSTVSGNGVLTSSGTALVVIEREGTGSISGRGALSAAASSGRLGSGVVSGSGAIVSSGASQRAGEVSVSGRGFVSSDGHTDRFGSSLVQGGGQLVSRGSAHKSGAGFVSGGGSLSSSGTALVVITRDGFGVISGGGQLASEELASRGGSGSVSSGGLLSSDGFTRRSGTSSITGGGYIEANAAASARGVVHLSGGGVLSSSGSKSTGGYVFVSASGSVSSSGIAYRRGISHVSGDGEIAARGFTYRYGTSSVSGGGSVEVDSEFGMRGSGVVSGNGELRTTGTSSRHDSGVVSGGGFLASSGAAERFGTSSISGGGHVEADAASSVRGVAHLSGGGFISSQGMKDSSGEGSISSQGSLFIDGVAHRQGHVSVVGNGSVDVGGYSSRHGTSSIIGGGNLSSDGLYHRFGEGVVTGGGDLQSSGFSTISEDGSGTARISGSGEIGSSGRTDRSGSATVSGQGFVSSSGKKSTGGTSTVSGYVQMAWVTSGRSGRKGSSSILGGGDLEVQGTVARSGIVFIVGGGSIVATSTSSKSGAGFISGGGSISSSSLLRRAIAFGISSPQIISMGLQSPTSRFLASFKGMNRPKVEAADVSTRPLSFNTPVSHSDLSSYSPALKMVIIQHEARQIECNIAPGRLSIMVEKPRSFGSVYGSISRGSSVSLEKPVLISTIEADGAISSTRRRGISKYVDSTIPPRRSPREH